jgi:tRNA threonylcarbamoyladenosine biosynthesis protein TsaE
VRIELADASATRALGVALTKYLAPGDLVILVGNLGAGKTTLAQGIGAGLGVEGTVASPTFIIARAHPPAPGRPALIHVDAYRLGSLAELDDLDLDESMEDSVTVVEWGAGIAEVLAESRLIVELERQRGGALDDLDAGIRTATVTGYGPRWEGVALQGLALDRLATEA